MGISEIRKFKMEAGWLTGDENNDNLKQMQKADRS